MNIYYSIAAERLGCDNRKIYTECKVI